MLSVASPSLPRGSAFAADVTAAAALLDFEDEDANGGATSTEHSLDFAGDDPAAMDEPLKPATKRFSLEVEKQKTTTVVRTQESDTVNGETNAVDEDANDSDYRPDEEDEDDDNDDEEEEDESEDDEAYLQSLEAQLDEHADEVGDYYLQRMVEKRATLEGDEAAWVDSYIERQRKWKEMHGTSIDEMDLDLLRPARRRISSSKKARKTKSARGRLALDAASLADAWNGRVSPYLPASLRDQPIEFLLSLGAVALFVGLALAVQFYVAFKAPAQY